MQVNGVELRAGRRVSSLFFFNSGVVTKLTSTCRRKKKGHSCVRCAGVRKGCHWGPEPEKKRRRTAKSKEAESSKMARTSEDTDLEVDLRDGIGMSLLTEATRLRVIMKDGFSMIERGFEEMTTELRIVKEQIFNQRLDLEDWVEGLMYEPEEKSESESDEESEQDSDKEMEEELEELAEEVVEAKKKAEAKKSEGEKGEEMNEKDNEEEKGTEDGENGKGLMTQKKAESEGKSEGGKGGENKKYILRLTLFLFYCYIIFDSEEKNE